MTSPKKTAGKRASRGGRPPADESEQRKAALLDAATEVFLEAGFSGAKMSTIAKRAGSSMETLYARYLNKAELFTAIIERKASCLFDVIGPLDPASPPRETLTHYGFELITMLTMPDTQKLHRVVIAGSIEAPELGIMFWEAGPGRGFQIVRTYLHAQKVGGTLNVEDPDRAAGMLTGMLVGGIALRSTLGLPTAFQTQEARKKWAAYVVDNFLKTLQ